MPKISSIPDRYIDGFKKISLIDDDYFEAIKEGLSYSSLVSSIGQLAKKISEYKKLNENDLRKMFISVGSLTPYLENEDSVNGIVNDIANIAIETKLIESDNIKNFINRVLFLLANKHIYYASKTHDLITEYGNVYISSRIASDIRTVFDINIDELPKCGVIVHNLHIHYRADEESDHKDIYLALDSNDIKALKETLIRAERKEISLQNLFSKLGIANLNE